MHTANCNVETTLLNPVKLREWRLCALPSDSLSTQNAIIMDNGRRYPLLIDPQGQANRYIRAMGQCILSDNPCLLSCNDCFIIYFNPNLSNVAKDTSSNPPFAPNGIDIIKLSDKNYLRTLENAIQFGRWVLLENIGESLGKSFHGIST